MVYSLHCEGGDLFLPDIVVDGLLQRSGPAKSSDIIYGYVQVVQQKRHGASRGIEFPADAASG